MLEKWKITVSYLMRKMERYTDGPKVLTQLLCWF